MTKCHKVMSNCHKAGVKGHKIRISHCNLLQRNSFCSVFVIVFAFDFFLVLIVFAFDFFILFVLCLFLFLLFMLF